VALLASDSGGCHTFEPAGSKGEGGQAVTKTIFAANRKRASRRTIAPAWCLGTRRWRRSRSPTSSCSSPRA